MKTWYVLFFVVMIVMVGTASAEVRHDQFTGLFSENNTIHSTSGTGWNNGEWVYYPDTGWWNQWFYNDPPDPERWKKITYEIWLNVDASPGTEVDIAINWSTMAFPESGPDGSPPIPPVDEDLMIHREIIYSGDATDEWFLDNPLTGEIIVCDYNPEWVSIDVQAQLGTNGGMMVEGWIDHECIPEPATVGLLALGSLVISRRRRKG